MQIARRALIRERIRLLNRSRTQTLAILKSHSIARLGQIRRQLTELEEALPDLAHLCPKRVRAVEILWPVYGPGRVTAVAILIRYPETGTMARKRIARLAGLAAMT
jgi:transposase